MVRNFLLTLSFLFVASFAFGQQTVLQGKVKDNTGEELIGANIVITKSQVYITGTATDIDGNFSLNLDPGTYDVEISYTGQQTQKIAGVLVKAGQSNKLDVNMTAGSEILKEIEVVEYKVPLIEVDQTQSGGVVTSEQIRNLPTRNINAVAATTAGLSTSDEGGAISIKGSRSDATDYYIDGIRVRGSLIPESEIEQLQVITGGIGAKYGDVTGGIISITTKGPSARYSGGVEAETSEYLDAFGQSLVGANVSGPILKNKEGQSILGFRFSGRYTYLKDDSPAATGVYRVKESKYNELVATPVQNNISAAPTAQYLTNDDVELVKTRPNEANSRGDVTAKLDARLSNNIDVSFTGTYSTGKNQFTPGGWGLLNTANNPFTTFSRYRGNFRFRHRLGGNAPADQAAKKSIVSKFEYILQAGYEFNNSLTEDPRHKDNFFNYGYVGKTDFEWSPSIDMGFEFDTLLQMAVPFANHVGYDPGATIFTPNNDINPGLGAYNQFVTDILNEDGLIEIRDEDILIAQNGATTASSSSVFGFHTNVSAVYNSYQKSEGNLITAAISSSFDFHPGGSDKGRHSIQLGFLYEQREDRAYSIAPSGLWIVADFNDNRHILPGVDTSDVIGMIDTVDLQGNPISIPQYNTLISEDPDLLFYKSIRAINGEGVHDFVNVDNYDPSQLSLDMFSAVELTDQGVVGFYGYDYLGNPVGPDVTFDDFFTATTVSPFGGEIRAFPVAPNTPNYIAGYIEDKFTYKDIIFRVGVRVDRFDANTKVLKDPFSLYDIINVRDFYARQDVIESGQIRPPGVDDDYKVYISGQDDIAVKGFRNGTQWYFENGSPANDGNVIFGNVAPDALYTNPKAGGSWIKQRGYDPDDGFEDYEPQINVMPRLAFSFPISDVANFFAHYDILVQRPPGNNIATALSYYYFGDAGRTPESNPNLKPEKTIDYEVGFQQKLNNSSALKISAYYKELRDMIQVRDFLFVPSDLNIGGEYIGYDNLDFGTVKGFTFQYDLRRTNNVTMQAAYTLQFADGTGSGANSSRNLGSRGNIRTLFPLSFDERHRFNLSIDYRYAYGKGYNGPVLFGKDIFSNAGINIQTVAVSGRPYTASLEPRAFGGEGTKGDLNGARLPWNFTLNFRVDKSFRLYTPTNSTKRPVDLNVYLRIQNALDRRNLLGVYSATGSAEDDGYLNSSQGKAALEEQRNQGLLDFYLPSYSWRLLNPGFYTLPRRIYIGAIVEF